MGRFARCFLSLDPGSAHALTPQALMSALPRRKAMLESIESDGVELNELEEEPLDDHHALVRASWLLRPRGEPTRESVILKSTFVLRREQRAWQIVVYLNHQDMATLSSSLGAEAT